MAVRVVEGKDYKILDDNYRYTFIKTYAPKKSLGGKEYYRCMYCGCKVSKDDMQVDHIVPKTRLKAGILWNPNRAWNLGPSCPHCNQSKSNALDKRVFVGFRNKMLSNLGIAMGSKEEQYSEDNKTTALIGLMIALVSVFVCVALPLFYIAMGTVSMGYKFVKWFVTKCVFKTIRKSIKKAFKVMKRFYFRHPVRNTIVMALLVYIAKVAPEVYTKFFVGVVGLIQIAMK